MQYDEEWIDKLFAAANDDRLFGILDTSEFWQEKWGKNYYYKFRKLREKVDKKYPHLHRAAADVRKMIEVYKEFKKLT